MKLLPASVVLFSFLSGCGGPTVDENPSALSRPSFTRLTTDRFAAERLIQFRHEQTSQQAACSPDAAPTTTSHVMNLWPPNHTMHAIAPSDCVTVSDDCDEDLQAQLVWASSDEPVNSIGDGNTGPDIVFSCDGVELRSERQGPQNGRVYHIGWRVEDSGGNVVEGDCKVIVDHDQSGVVAEDDGENNRVELDSAECEEPQPPPEPFGGCPNADDPNCL